MLTCGSIQSKNCRDGPLINKARFAHFCCGASWQLWMNYLFSTAPHNERPGVQRQHTHFLLTQFHKSGRLTDLIWPAAGCCYVNEMTVTLEVNLSLHQTWSVVLALYA